MQGYVKLFRELLKHPLWKDGSPEQKCILVTLLLMANHDEGRWLFKGEEYHVKPGQFITSIQSIKEACGKGISTQNVRTALVKFEKHGFLTNQSTNHNRLITIENWGKWQVGDGDVNKAINKQLTSNQQATNKQLTTNKNDKKDKNDKNDYYSLNLEERLMMAGVIGKE